MKRIVGVILAVFMLIIVGNLGLTYLQKRNAENAILALKESAAQGNPIAQIELGEKYLHGDGVPKDDIKAVEWYQKSAAQGNKQAQYELDYINNQPDELKKVATQVLWERFGKFVDDGNNYLAALVTNELCIRGSYSNINEQGMLEFNCKLILSSNPNDVSFDQGGGSGPIDFKGMAFLKKDR